MTSASIEARLIDVAIELFGRDGMDAVGTRAIADAAGAQMSAITYHFGGKEGLYLACARHIAAQMSEHWAPLLELTRAACAAHSGAPQARAAVAAILSGFVGIMMQDDTAHAARFIVREQMNPTPAFAILFEGAMQPGLERMDALLQRIAGRRLPPDQLRVRAIALMGQVLAFRFARATLMRATGWESVGATETRIVQGIVATHTNAILSDLEQGAHS
jgi:TetR/AcrR family transcriptional regulator, regulator of cefoperazone and chloramphenicol sensitivity